METTSQQLPTPMWKGDTLKIMMEMMTDGRPGDQQWTSCTNLKVKVVIWSPFILDIDKWVSCLDATPQRLPGTLLKMFWKGNLT